jgi:hypothetical protein
MEVWHRCAGSPTTNGGSDPRYFTIHTAVGIMTPGTIDNSGWDCQALWSARSSHQRTPHNNNHPAHHRHVPMSLQDSMESMTGKVASFLFSISASRSPTWHFLRRREFRVSGKQPWFTRTRNATSTDNTLIRTNINKCSTWDASAHIGRSRGFFICISSRHAHKKLCRNTVGQPHHSTAAPRTRPAQSSQHSAGDLLGDIYGLGVHHVLCAVEVT